MPSHPPGRNSFFPTDSSKQESHRMSDPLVMNERIGPAAVRLTFNRPDKLNALSTPLLDQFEAALDGIEADPGVRVVVLTGAGHRAFVAGADIAEYRGNRTAEFNAYQLRSRALFDRLEAFSKPTIAAIRGYALGGGFEIALCCDILICARDARLGLPEGLLGLCPGGGGTQRLTRAVGRYVAADMLLAARRITGERAYQLGIAAECVAAEDLDAAVLKRIDALLAVAPSAQAAMKALIRKGPDMPLPDALTLEQDMLFGRTARSDTTLRVRCTFSVAPPARHRDEAGRLHLQVVQKRRQSIENPYYQHFTGETFFHHRPPIDPPSLRLGANGSARKVWNGSDQDDRGRPGLWRGHRQEPETGHSRYHRDGKEHRPSDGCPALRARPGIAGGPGE